MYPLRPIAILRTVFPEKFGVPRQSGIVEAAAGTVEFTPEFARPEFVRGLAGFSHLWLITWFHQSPPWDGQATVRPPRLGGSERVGIFATRSPHRPHPIGLSLVRLLSIETAPRLLLRVAGIDAVDGTPVLDIKPYLPWCESRPDATAAWADAPPPARPPEAIHLPPDLQARILAGADGPATLALLTDLLRHDPQPAHHDPAARTYGMSVAGWNIQWRLEHDQVIVQAADPIPCQPDRTG